MNTSAAADHAAIVARIVDKMQRESAPGLAQQVEKFAGHYTHRISEQALGQREPEIWAALLKNHFELARKRLRDQRVVRVFNPTMAADGWVSDHTIVQVVHPDMPFLVDSTTMAIAAQRTEIHLLAHPLFQVARDAGGYLMDVAGGTAELAGASAESLMHFEINRLSEGKALADLKQRIEGYLQDVTRAVEDWETMTAKFAEASDHLAEANTPYSEESVAETIEFLNWLADNHFTTLGYREYHFSNEQGKSLLRAVDGSGLGILRNPNGGQVSTVSPVRVLEPIQINEAGPLVMTKTNARSTVHRVGYMDYVGVMMFDEQGHLVGERRFLGLYTSSAYNRRPWNIPYLRRKVANIMAGSGFSQSSHGGKALLHIMATLPRDELLQASQRELADLVIGIYDMQERRKTRLFVRADQFGRFYSCLVYIPRDRFNTETRERVQEVLQDAFAGDQIDYTVQIDDSVLARVHVIVRISPDSKPSFDLAQVEAELVTVVRSWHDRLTDVLIHKYGEEQGVVWARTYGGAFPAAYIEDVAPWVAAFDVEHLAELTDENDLRLSLYQPRERRVGQPAGLFRFKIFRSGSTLPLSDVLPMLENMGLRVVSERPYQLNLADGSSRWVQDFDIQMSDGSEVPLAEIRENFQDAFERVVRGDSESDGFNRLISIAKLGWQQVAVLRTYCKYLLQTGLPFSQVYIERTMAAHPGIARLTIELFETRFDPDRKATSPEQAVAAKESLLALLDVPNHPQLAELIESTATALEREARTKLCTTALQHAIEQVSSLDEDRILRGFAEVVAATLRTNAFQPNASGSATQYICVKLDSSMVSELPKPRPWREIFVYSPRVEGIHLRGGPVARGGLRWSDRPEDFRTEVLGLMKAQMVKNTIIVPVGAKGGFVVKRLPNSKDREVVMAEVVACYRLFINGLLDISDNLVEGEVAHPKAVARHDADDPYLVVAADKGTATFSDIANSVSQAHNFWMGDAFASGGSVGYDHKGMGITAKGGWESVKRHFRELGIDCQSQDISVVGVGDMAGDVFGNGMLLSKHIKLIAAFNHLHIFLDPTPDAASSFAERKRLFELPRSAWTDYDQKLISEGGGIFSRSDKTIPLSPQVREMLGVKATALPPIELIELLLKAPVDLLWNGGIGTYVKASTESHGEVGDRANDALRIDGKQLRCKVVGEGGNLGLTQRGRIEYALAGGRINTDFVDNSAGVDCSDHEVNIKIMLNDVMRSGQLTLEQRNQLLASMTDEVEQLVLRNNYLQTQALTMMEGWTVARLGSQAHLLDLLESSGSLDREIEFLPNREEIAERRSRGVGLTRPELSTLLAYAKITLYQDLLDSDVPEDPYLSNELERYFPQPLAQYQEQMQRHRLRREIIVTAVTNSMVNRMGATFCVRMQEDTGASPAEVAKAYTAAREIFSARHWWDAVEQADNRLAADRQTALQLMIWDLLRHATRWLLNHHRQELDIAALVKRYQPGAQELVRDVPSIANVSHGRRFNTLQRQFERDGVGKKLSAELVGAPALNSALDVISVAHQHKVGTAAVAEVYFYLDKTLKVSWLLDQIQKLPVEGQWHAHARGGLRDGLYRQHQLLTAAVICSADPVTDQSMAKAMKRWLKRHGQALTSYDHMLGDMKASGGIDYATASVSVRALEQLVQQVGT